MSDSCACIGARPDPKTRKDTARNGTVARATRRNTVAIMSAGFATRQMTVHGRSLVTAAGFLTHLQMHTRRNA
jgi:hypothetical protein